MNKVILMGRVTKDIDVKYTAGDNPTAERASRIQISLIVLLLESKLSLQESTLNKVQNFLFVVEFKREVILTVIMLKYM